MAASPTGSSPPAPGPPARGGRPGRSGSRRRRRRAAPRPSRGRCRRRRRPGTPRRSVSGRRCRTASPACRARRTGRRSPCGAGRRTPCRHRPGLAWRKVSEPPRRIGPEAECVRESAPRRGRRLDRVEGEAQALVEARLRAPAELALGPGRVERDPLHLAASAAGRTRARSSSRPLSSPSVRTSSSTSVSTPGADVDRRRSPPTRPPPAPPRPRRPHICSRGSAVPSPKTVGRPARPQQAAEDRDHPGLAERVLARPVDVAEPQGDPGEPVEALVERQVALGGELALAVGGHRRDRRAPRRAAAACPRPRRRSRRRWRRSTTRRRRAARAASSTLAVPPTLIEASKAGSCDRLADVDLGGEVEDRLGPALAGQARSAPAASRMSISTSSAPAARAPSRFSRRPVERSSTTVTSSPRASRASTRFEPMKPAPPVTKHLIRRRSYASGGTAGP